MTDYFDEKVSFTKSIKVIDTKKDYEMDGPSYKFALWKDPSRDILSGFFNIVTTNKEELSEMSEEELQELNDKFYHAVSAMVVDCNIAQLDFSTPEKAEESMDHPEVDAGFVLDVLVRYANDLIGKSRLLKNA